MTTALAKNILQYQNVAPKQVISAVHQAAKKTGVDFAFLMDKAKTESSFNPDAKARKSSATGLFQFIEQTWLSMIKNHGAKYGLKDYADKIEIRDGKAVVADAAAKNEILNLRRNPEISALMAGEFSAENKEYLENCTTCDIGSTELYLAHFMGAGGAAKFLNSRNENGSTIAAHLFPKAARANKNVFFDQTTGRARSLDEIYNNFSKKFTGGNPSSIALTAPSPSAARQTADQPGASTSLSLQDVGGRALPSFANLDDRTAGRWNRAEDTARSGFSGSISPVNLAVLQEMQETLSQVKESRRYNS